MTFTRRPLAQEDNAVGRLNAGISAAATSIVLSAGQGALFPATKNGSATSGGTATTLNSTGIQAAGVVAGDIIENVTDGSYAVVVSVSTNAAVTTRLKGGSTNVWNNTNKWHVGRFVITLINYDTDGVTILKREKALIDSRSTDTLTVNASGRGYDGSTAQSFVTNDYVYIFVTTAQFDAYREALSQIIQDIDQLVSQSGAEIYAADTVGTDAYAITLVPAITAYANGQVFNFKAGTANTGNATLNVNGLGAKNILKNHDQTLDDGDIEVGQIVTVAYDTTGGAFQMQSQIANLFASKTNIQKNELIYAADSVGSDSYAVTLSPVPAALTGGMAIYFKAGTVNTGPATLNVNSLGAKAIKKNYNSDLSDGDIKAGQLVQVCYDVANDVWQMLSPVSNQPPSPPIYEQNLDVPVLAAGTSPFDSFTTENTNAGVMWSVACGSAGQNLMIRRYAIDTLTGQWYVTHTLTTSVTSSSQSQIPGMCVVGTYLYIWSENNGGTVVCTRFAKADLTGETNMTISGTAPTAGAPRRFVAYTDQTSMFVCGNTASTWYRYTISGTTATNAQTLTAPATNANDAFGSAWCDGTNVYALTDGSGSLAYRTYRKMTASTMASLGTGVIGDTPTGVGSTGSHRFYNIGNPAMGMALQGAVQTGVVMLLLGYQVDSNSAAVGQGALLMHFTKP